MDDGVLTNLYTCMTRYGAVKEILLVWVFGFFPTMNASFVLLFVFFLPEHHVYVVEPNNWISCLIFEISAKFSQSFGDLLWCSAKVAISFYCLLLSHVFHCEGFEKFRVFFEGWFFFDTLNINSYFWSKLISSFGCDGISGVVERVQQCGRKWYHNKSSSLYPEDA